MRSHPYDDLVVLDVTASETLADDYVDFASYGFHVISANKIAGRRKRHNIVKFAMRSQKQVVTGYITRR